MRQVRSGVVRHDCADADHGGVVLAAEAVGEFAGVDTGDPLALAGAGGDLAVQRAGEFEGDKRTALADAGEEAGKGVGCFALEEAGFYLDAGGAEAVEALAADAGIWVGAGDDDAGYAGFDEGVGAGGRFAGVAAGFEGDVDGRTFSGFAGGGQGLGFGMGAAAGAGAAAGDHPALLHDDAADGGVGPGGAKATAGQGDRGAHEGGVGHFRVSSMEWRKASKSRASWKSW